MDVYFEQSVDNPNIDKHSKRTRVLTILRYICIGAIVLIAMLGWVMPIGTEETASVATLLWALLYIVLAIIPFILTFIFLGKFIANSSLEYDYLLNGSLFRIVKVINRKKRKKLLEVPVGGFESLGAIESDAYDRFAASKDTKKLYAITDYSREDRIYYIYYIVDGTKYLLHITPNNDMIMALRKSVTRITILDKSFKAHEED